LELHVLQELFRGKDKAIAVIPKNLDCISFLVAKNERNPVGKRIQLELQAYNGHQSIRLLAKVTGPANDYDALGIPCEPA